MRVRLTLLAAALLLAAAAPSRTQELKAEVTAEELVGSYGYATKWGGSKRTFAAGGKYKSPGGSCTHEYLSEGTYEVAGGRVVIHITSAKQWPNGAPERAEELKLEERWKQERLLPVRWGARLYLIDEDDLLKFCNAVNAGVEPRGGEDDPDYAPFLLGSYFGSFYLRDGDEKKKVKGAPQLPEEWRRFLLKEPIEGSVLSVGGDGGEVIVVNVGARHGLRAGMLFFAESGGGFPPPSIFNGLEVLSVEEETAKLRGPDDLKVGDKVSTKYTLPKELRQEPGL